MMPLFIVRMWDHSPEKHRKVWYCSHWHGLYETVKSPR
jgi:hypothetical protein